MIVSFLVQRDKQSSPFETASLASPPPYAEANDMPVQGRQRAAQLKPNSCPLVQEAADLNPCPQTKLCFASSHETEFPQACSQTEVWEQEGKSTYWIRIGNSDIVICLFYQFRAQTDSMTCADPPSWPGGQSALNATPLRQMTPSKRRKHTFSPRNRPPSAISPIGGRGMPRM